MSIALGHTFDWSNNQLSRKESWAEFLKLEERPKILDTYKMLSKAQTKGLRTVLGDIEGWKAKPVLDQYRTRFSGALDLYSL